MNDDTRAVTDKPLSIDAVLKQLHDWRENKSSYPNGAIPDTIWQMIFALEDAGHRPTTLRSLFSLNSGQYAKKHEQLTSGSTAKSDKSTEVPSKIAESAKGVF